MNHHEGTNQTEIGKKLLTGPYLTSSQQKRNLMGGISSNQRKASRNVRCCHAKPSEASPKLRGNTPTTTKPRPEFEDTHQLTSKAQTSIPRRCRIPRRHPRRQFRPLKRQERWLSTCRAAQSEQILTINVTIAPIVASPRRKFFTCFNSLSLLPKNSPFTFQLSKQLKLALDLHTKPLTSQVMGT